MSILISLRWKRRYSWITTRFYLTDISEKVGFTTISYFQVQHLNNIPEKLRRPIGAGAEKRNRVPVYIKRIGIENVCYRVLRYKLGVLCTFLSRYIKPHAV